MNKFTGHMLMFRRAVLSAAVLLLCPITGMTAKGADYALTNTYSMPGGPLDDALREFSDQSGISVIYDHRIVSGRVAPAVLGPLTTRDALNALLDGSPLEYREIDSSTLAIIERPRVIELMPELPPNEFDLKPDDPRIDEIIVTTSYRAPGVHAGLNVDYALDAEALNLSGSQSIAEPIHELPTTVASISSANTQLLVSAGGLDLTDLRGLGPKRSLALVNGRRFVRTSGGNGDIYGVDLNAIPTSLIDRVEVINQSAGPTLGTDAIGGAVNIVMRDHINGVSLGAHGGISERGDSQEYSLSIFTGTEFADGRGKISGGGVFAMDPSLFFSERDYLAEPYGFALNGRLSNDPGSIFTPGFGGSQITPAGFISGAVGSNGAVTLFPDQIDQLRLTSDGFEIFEGRLDQLYNWVDGFSALPERDRLHGYLRTDYELSNNISLFGEFFFADIETTTQIAAAPVSAFRGLTREYGDSILVPADHPNAPAGLRSAIETIFGGPIDSFLIARRFVELGPRRRDIDRRTLDFLVGANLDLGDDWSLNASYGLSRSRTFDRSFNKIDAARITAAVDPLLCSATPGCEPLNIFSAETVAPPVADFYRLSPRTRRIETTEHVARITANGPIYTIGDTEARVSAGVEYRRDILKDGGSVGATSIAALSELTSPGVRGSVGYAEFFAGADLPLRSEDDAAGAIMLGTDGRLTRWSGDGFVANVSGDLSWTPTGGLEFYVFALYGGRAPNVIELFSAGLDVAQRTLDPCSTPLNEIVTENCASNGPLGVPPGFLQHNALTQYNSTGNPNLGHEKIHTRHFGVAMDVQEFFYLNDNALRITADWRFHHIKNGIDGTNGFNTLIECYASANLSSPFCGVNPATGILFIQRDATNGQLLQINRTRLNRSEIRTNGLDASLAYRGELLWAPLAPAFSLDILYSYARSMKFRGTHDETLAELAGLANFPRHQTYATAGLETDRWKTLWTVRRRGATQTINANIPAAKLPGTTYVDAGLQFRPNDNVIIYAGVENLFDKELPVAAFAERGFFAEFYDVIGRRYFAGVKTEF